MALPNRSMDGLSNGSLLEEDKVVDILEKEWKNLLFLGFLILLGIWFYGEYRETITQKEGDASSQFTSISIELNSLISESIKDPSSKDLLEKQDRIEDNLRRLIKLNSDAYSPLAHILKVALSYSRGKEPSSDEIELFNKSVSSFERSPELLPLYEIAKLIYIKAKISGTDKAQGLKELSTLIKTAKFILPQAASTLVVFSSDEQLNNSLDEVRSALKSRPELEEATKRALSELGISL